LAAEGSTRPLAILHDSSILKEISMSFLAEFWQFLRMRRKLFLIPLIVLTVVLGAVMLLAQSSAVAPFIYTLF
jgi:hypothetical protein